MKTTKWITTGHKEKCALFFYGMAVAFLCVSLTGEYDPEMRLAFSIAFLVATFFRASAMQDKNPALRNFFAKKQTPEKEPGV